jgi:hypothetical protein
LFDDDFDKRIVAFGGYTGVDDCQRPGHHVIAGDQHEAEINRSQYFDAENAAAESRQHRKAHVTDDVDRDHRHDRAPFGVDQRLELGALDAFDPRAGRDAGTRRFDCVRHAPPLDFLQVPRSDCRCNKPPCILDIL